MSEIIAEIVAVRRGKLAEGQGEVHSRRARPNP